MPAQALLVATSAFPVAGAAGWKMTVPSYRKKCGQGKPDIVQCSPYPSGIPVVTEEGKGYTLMEGYRIPPVMFTEQQANALILAQQLVLKSKDTSFVKDYSEAIEKIQSVLRHTIKDKTNLLADRTRFDFNTYRERTSNYLSDLQAAITNFCVINIRYTNEAGDLSERLVEPFALLSTQEDNWLLIAWCRLREAFRYFRVDRIEHMSLLSECFPAHKMTLQEFFDNYY